MNILTKLTNFLTPTKTYSLVKPDSESTELVIRHHTGVIIKIDKDGSVLVSTPYDLKLHSGGDMELTSDTHIGLVAPRIDLN